MFRCDASFSLGKPFSSPRSEEHTSELQSRQYLVCRLLLEKKKKNNQERKNQMIHTQAMKNQTVLFKDSHKEQCKTQLIYSILYERRIEFSWLRTNSV